MALSGISASHCLAGERAGFLPGRSGLPCGGSDAGQFRHELGCFGRAGRGGDEAYASEAFPKLLCQFGRNPLSSMSTFLAIIVSMRPRTRFDVSRFSIQIGLSSSKMWLGRRIV